MNKRFSSLFIALSTVTLAGTALADSAAAANPYVIQVAASNPVQPTMSHEVATLIKFTHNAEAQYRRSGSPQDLARVKAMRVELASRGFGRATQAAPSTVMTSNSSDAGFAQPGSVVVSFAE
ncbi:MAG: hypothetical protein KA740_00635 [Rhodoferax sp.]|jgi:hypothetical protein|nr:hypothetical protein [Rhodoferax sp.]